MWARIVRDYEQYIARQFKRGTSRQELNVSWLKKNEMELKRHVNELRDSVRNNWSTTGQELTKELRQFWQNSRPGSPARLSRSPSEANLADPLRSPTAVSHLAHLDVPMNRQGASNDFATGYSLGLIGGVRSWVSHSRSIGKSVSNQCQMTRRPISLRGSRPGSPGSSEEDDSDDTKSPKLEQVPTRGRKGQRATTSTDTMET